jgi:hypothetical protein
MKVCNLLYYWLESWGGGNCGNFDVQTPAVLLTGSPVFTQTKICLNLEIVVPSIFKYSNKTPNQMHQSVVKCIA